jgi:prepilin-type N-terminal cleavage/methylation domain-containing protein
MATTRTDWRRAQGGFSLLEALAAMAMLAVAMLALNMTSITLARSTKTADSASAATGLAQETLEVLRALPPGHAMHVPGDYQDPNNPIDADGTPGGVYTRRWRISPVDVPDFGLKTATVTVAWTDPAGDHAMQLAAFVRCSEVPCP